MTVDEPTLSHAEIAAIAARIGRPIVLVGLMGVGKSSVGRRLAATLHLPFTDADDAIEEAAQMTINEIFAAHGEQDFRDGERRVIARLMDEARGVIATGGGAFVNDETRALILEKGIPVWLDADLDTLVERVGRKDNRPLITGKDPLEVLTDLAAVRYPIYAEADVTVETGDTAHHVTVDQVIQALTTYLQGQNP